MSANPKDKKEQQFCDNCGEPAKPRKFKVYTELPFNVESANRGESGLVCLNCDAVLSGKKPTPGKWRLIRWTAEDHPEDGDFDTRYTFDVVRGDKSEILGIFEIPNAADARLIEQAPVLLALVKEFRDFAKVMLDGSGEDTGEGKLIRHANVVVREIERGG